MNDRLILRFGSSARSRLLLSAMGVVLALVLAACSNGGGGGAPGY